MHWNEDPTNSCLFLFPITRAKNTAKICEKIYRKNETFLDSYSNHPNQCIGMRIQQIVAFSCFRLPEQKIPQIFFGSFLESPHQWMRIQQIAEAQKLQKSSFANSIIIYGFLTNSCYFPITGLSKTWLLDARHFFSKLDTFSSLPSNLDTFHRKVTYARKLENVVGNSGEFWKQIWI